MGRERDHLYITVPNLFRCPISMDVMRSPVLDSILPQSGVNEQLSRFIAKSNGNYLASIRLVLQKGSLSSKIESCLKLLSTVATCAEGRSAISGEEKCAGAVAERLMKVSRGATEDGVAVLWSVCCMLGDKRARESVAGGNVVAKVLLVMQNYLSENVSMP
ncbi:unnamed protein product [Malus baccata var. baccata]